MLADKKLGEYILGCLRSGEYFVTAHARGRGRQRNFGTRDIEAVGMNGQVFSQEAKTTFKVVGKDATNDELTLIVAVEDGVIVVTGF